MRPTEATAPALSRSLAPAPPADVLIRSRSLKMSLCSSMSSLTGAGPASMSTVTAHSTSARDCASPQAVKAAVVDGKGVRPTRIGREPRASGVPRRHSGAQLTLAYERRMVAMADRHIGAARTRIPRRRSASRRSRATGHDTALGLQ